MCIALRYDTLIRPLEMPSIFSRMITERYSLVSAHTLAALRFVRSTSARRPVGPSARRSTRAGDRGRPAASTAPPGHDALAVPFFRQHRLEEEAGISR